MAIISYLMGGLVHTGQFIEAHPYQLIGLLLPLVIPLIVFQLLPLMVLIERRGAAFIQDRVGPNRAALYPLSAMSGNLAAVFSGDKGGFRVRGFGIVFTLTDLVKLLFKENFVPSFAFKSFYWVAPCIPVITGLLATSLIPWFAPINYYKGSGGMFGELFGTIITTPTGLLLLFAFSSLSVYGIVLGSWSSNSKFSLLGGMRASAMMISYEVSMGLAVLGLLLIIGSFSLTDVVEWQVHRTWGAVVQPVGFALFMISMFAECNRNPFDVAEGESEIVAGFHTEFNGMKFMMYMTAEYLHMIVASALMVTLYLGGYQLLPVPGWDSDWEKANLGGYIALVLVPVAVVLLVAGALVLGRKAHYSTLQASDRESRRVEYSFFSSVFLGGALALVVVALVSWLFFKPTVIGHLADQRPVFSGLDNLIDAVLEFVVLIVKTILVACLFVWVRWTLPRFRYDQIMALGWKVMLNIAIVNLLLTAVAVEWLGMEWYFILSLLFILTAVSIVVYRLKPAH
jgi:NADH-quinone oxidoreductase subunit H